VDPRPGEHRAVAPEEHLEARWLIRRKSASGWQIISVVGPRAVSIDATDAAKSPDTPQPSCESVREKRTERITPKVRRGIARAAQMLAEGKSMADIAEALGVTVRAIEYWKTQHRKLWNRDFRLAIQDVVSQVRKDAGTDRVVAAPDEYMRLAKLADKWTAETHQELFPQSDIDLSLTGFYRAYYLPTCLGGTVPGTRRQYEICLRLWARITGDPPLRLVTNETVAKFRDTLSAMKGQGGRPYSPNSVRSKLTQIQAILDAAGPPGPRHRDAAGILAKVPYAKPPREELDVPRIISFDILGRVYEAARFMDSPGIDGISSPDWWRALLAVALNTALRRATLFALRWDFLDDRNLVLPKHVLKTRRGMTIPLNDTAFGHLKAIRSDREMIFPWPYTRECFDHHFSTLQGLAGVPRGERFGLQAIRRTAATLLWKQCPQAAQIILGHHAATITLRHYVNANEVAKPALANLPQPAAFSEGAGQST